LIVLAALSIGGGLVGIPAVFMEDSHILGKFLAPVVASQEITHPAIHLTHSTELALMGGLIALILLMIFIASKKYANLTEAENADSGISKVLANKWYVDELYNAIIVKPIEVLSSFLSRIVDNKIIDGFVNGIGRSVQYSARQLRLLQSGQVGSYVLIMVVSIIIFFIFQLFWKF
jgi:NADH-quinone oxidoreductase subunit L